MAIERVLLVDDDPDVRHIGALSLARVGGWTVLEADSGLRALEILEDTQPDLILLDVMMPELDGVATFERIRANSDLDAIPIIFLTAKVQRHEVTRYMDLGALGVIAKPFDPLSLPDQVRKILDES